MEHLAAKKLDLNDTSVSSRARDRLIPLAPYHDNTETGLNLLLEFGF